MSSPKISVVVPVYNAERYLAECLESLVGQSLKEIEFIIVNDGSEDNSLEIVQQYAKKDKRFVVINKTNSGYGDSMNQGIAKARGEYVGIVEPDDFCQKKMFEILHELAKKEDADIARGSYFYHTEDGDEVRESIFAQEHKTVFEPIDDYKIFWEPPAIWSAIYRREFLKKNKIGFLPTPGASYQDAGFYLKTLACAKRIAFVDKPLYYYRVDNPNSSVKGAKKVFAVAEEYKSVEGFVSRLPGKEKLLKYCQVAKFGNYHWNLLRLSKADALKFIAFMKKDFMKEQRQRNLEREFFPKRYWASLSFLLRVSPRVFWAFFEMRNITKHLKGVIIKKN